MTFKLQLDRIHFTPVLRVFNDTPKGTFLVSVFRLEHPSMVSLGEACEWVLAGGFGGRVDSLLSLSAGCNGQIRLNSFRVSTEEVIKLQESIEHAVSKGRGVPAGIRRRGESD